MVISRTLVQLFLCVLFTGVAIYSYLDKQNELTNLRIRIPKEEKRILQLREEITRLALEIDKFEDPQNLMRIAAAGDFNHLSHPYLSNVITVEEGLAVTESCKNNHCEFSLSLPMGKQ